MAEAAGFVLAAFPIVVEGLRIYVNGIRTIKKLGSYRKDLEEVIRMIDMENEKLDVTLRSLLRDLVDESMLETLLDTPRISRWNDDDLQDSLRTLLGEKSLEVFSRGMRSMNEALIEFKVILDLDANNRVRRSKQVLTTILWFAKRHFCSQNGLIISSTSASGREYSLAYAGIGLKIFLREYELLTMT